MNACCAVFASLILSLAAAMPVHAAQIDFLAGTGEGSWQRQEITSIDARGDKTVIDMEYALLGEEVRDGVPHVWVQMDMQSYTVNRNGERTPGERAVMQVLVDKRVYSAGALGGMNALRGFGKEVIMQTGDSKPIHIRNAGELAAGAASIAGIDTAEPVIEPLGSESVTVPAGTFDAEKYKTSYRTETRAMFRKRTFDNESTVWVSEDIPFGIVKSTGSQTVNGKTSTVTMQAVAFGTSGAESKIEGTPEEVEIPAGVGEMMRSLIGDKRNQ